VTSNVDVDVEDLGAALPPGTTRADFVCGSYRISADIATGDRRLLDLLRDTTRHFVDVRSMRVAAADDENAEPVAYGDGLLSKAEIDWLAIRAEPSRAEARLYGFVKKTPVRVALVLPRHRIEGTVFVENASTDPTLYFLRGAEKSTERFLAVGSATVTSMAGATVEVGLAIVNRTAIKAFSVLR
jgi:hypothetical protein